ncbi:amino acid transporter [Campylobacter mucosalis]|uniref:dicarboxylate/amino acid:cation symporter n=1 Tax=Campylobacter mucosalis TaxID=202 RepID=UPI0004D431BB|nr:dicarboxylate/amino acid:cation symporter [Campylobacter mucosalis]KEA46687.1 amino acid transporter [Campylobacter mucosalis]QKF62787.1 sodium:dicarboxylate symporter, SDF family [Campylobacter mucosalis]
MNGQKGGILSLYFRINLLLRILIGLILGAIFGMIFENSQSFIEILTPFGELFVRLLKMIMVPVIVCTLIVGTSSISPSHLGRVGIKIIVFYLFTSLFAIIIGLFVGNVLEPGVGLELAKDVTGVAKQAEAPSLVKILLDIIPTNPFGSIAKGDVLPIICFCIFFGIALAFCRDSKDENVKNAADVMFLFFEGMSSVMFKIVGWVMQYAPIGVFALIFIVFSKNGAQAFGPLANVTISVYVGLLLQVVCVYCVICLFLKLSPFVFLKKVRPPMVTAFVTRSSGATIPVSMQTLEKSMGVPRSIFGFTIPVGATINMDGTTIYLGVCAIFIANVVGAPLDFSAQLTIVLTAVLASIGTAGVPGAGAIMLLMVLESVGLKVEGAVAIAYGMILGIDAILDMGRTSMNVVGDVIGSVAVAKSEKELNEKVWNS